MEDRLPRKLSAILCADVAGYSRLTGEDEEGTHRVLREYLDLIASIIQEHSGRVVHYAGDAVLADFGTVVDALSCAAAIQRELANRNSDLPDGRRLQFRIGVNLGDVIVDGEEIYGDGVNVAARLESLAEPGGTCISESVRSAVGNKLDLNYEFLGEQKVKNIAEPVRAYSVVRTTPEETEITEAVKPALTRPDKPSIVVLPFLNMSDEPEQEYFSDGVTEDIITALSRLRSLFVIARNTSFTYRGRAVDVQVVARDLGVRYVLEGSVRRAGSRLRISAQLADGEDGKHIWAEKYDRDLVDVFAVQDEITQTVVGAVQPELSRFEQDRARRKPPDRLDAWDLLQRGFWHYWLREPDHAEKAERLMLKSIELDPGLSAAYAGLCEVYYINLYHGWTATPEQTLNRALQAGRMAVSLDDKDAFAHFALGRVRTWQGEYELAIADLEEALRLNPNLAIACYGLGMALYRSGRSRDALPLFHKAIRQSPNDPLLFGFEGIIGAAHFQLGEYKEAEKWCKKAARHPTSSFWTHTYLALTLFELNQFDRARIALDDALRKQSDLSLTSFSDMLEHMHPEYRERILVGLRDIGLPK